MPTLRPLDSDSADPMQPRRASDRSVNKSLRPTPMSFDSWYPPRVRRIVRAAGSKRVQGTILDTAFDRGQKP